MPSTKTVLDTSNSAVKTVAFHPDGKHILSGGKDGIQRWRLEDRQEVGMQTGLNLNAISVTKDHKWIVCGTDEEGTSVWDEQLQKKVIHVEGGEAVNAVDVSPDSTAFATGINKAVSVWRITSGERLVGPLKHDFYVTAVRFSPNGERFATASSGRSIRVFDSHNGDELITINTVTPETWPSTLLAWSDDGLRIFAASTDNKIKLFDVSTGSQLAESQTLNASDDVYSVALAPNGKFMATFAGRIISFLDTSTLSLIAPVIQDSARIYAIAIAANSGYLATGLSNGKITIHDLRGILPDIYDSFYISNREEIQPDVRHSTAGGHDNEPSDTQDETGKFSPVEPKTHGEDRDDDLLEVQVPSSAPAPEFDFDEPPSPGSSPHHEDEVSPPEAPDAVAQLSDAIPAIYPPLAHAEEHLDTVESSQGISKLKRWLQTRTKKGNKDPASHKPPRKSRRPTDGRSPSQSPVRVDATNEGPSRMAAGQRVRRAVARPVVKRDPKSPAKDAHVSRSKKAASRSGQDSTKPQEAGPANDESHPSAEGVHLTHQRESGKATLEANVNVRLSMKMTFPAWMCCGSSTGDGTH